MSDLPPDKPYKPQTGMIHGGVLRSQFDETAEAIYMTSGFVYESAEEAEDAFKNDGTRFVYSRFRNPTVQMFEDRLAEWEGSERCFGTASGMAAVAAAHLSFLKKGDRVVASRALFGSCAWIVNELLPRYGIETETVDGTDMAAWEEALNRPAQAVFLETPSNPCLDIIDLPAVSRLAKQAGALVLVDNVFATPVFQQPLKLGADVVIYSATKHIDGQGRTLGGAILCSHDFAETLAPFLRHTGPAMSPMNAWVLLKGLETLTLRVKAQSETAHRIAARLQDHDAVESVIYPGLPSHPQFDLAQKQMSGNGNLIAFHLKGGKDAAFALLNALSLIKISNNLGDSKSLITHPATTTHQRLSDEERAAVGIGPGTVRLSVGLEEGDDLIADLDRALGYCRTV